MLLTVRSPDFIHAHHENGSGISGLLHDAAERTHAPWFSLTYLTHERGAGAWETVCAQSVEELRQHLRTVPDAQLADLLVMIPPRSLSRQRWSRFRVDLVQRGKHQGEDVLVYSAGARGRYCFDSPNVDPSEVTHRRTLLHVNWYRHFDN